MLAVVEKHRLTTPGARSRNLVADLHPLAGQVFDCMPEVVNDKTEVVKYVTVTEPRPHRMVVSQRLDELEGAAAHIEVHQKRALVVEHLSMRDGQSELASVDREGPVHVIDEDADMVNASEPGRRVDNWLRSRHENLPTPG